MNILVLHSSSGLYGSSKVLLAFTKTFSDHGHSVTVVLSEDGGLVDELRKTGIKVHIIKLGILRKKYYSVSGLMNRAYIIVKAFFSLRKIIKQEHTDLIYSNTTAVLIGGITARIMGKKHIWHVHEIIEKPSFLFKFLSWMLSHFCDKAIVVSLSVKDHWKKKVPIEKLQLIYNGFDYSGFDYKTSTLRGEIGITENQIVIGTIGRIHYWKGQDYFLAIAAQLVKNHPQLQFLIVGDAFQGYEYLNEKLMSITEKLSLQKNVHFLGYRSDITNVYDSIDLFVLPSIQPDPFPTVVLEAMASGIPIIATRQGGVVEMIEENQTGILIPLGDAEKAAELMDNLITNEQLRTQMGLAARERVLNRFSLESFNDAIIKAIQ